MEIKKIKNTTDYLALKKTDIKLVEKLITSVNFDEYPFDKTFDITNKIYFKKVKYKTKKTREYKYQNHKNSIDIYYSLKGGEKIYIANPNNLELQQPYCFEYDTEWYISSSNTSLIEYEIIIPEGDFHIILPGEAHEVNIFLDKSKHEKVIFKLLIN